MSEDFIYIGGYNKTTVRLFNDSNIIFVCTSEEPLKEAIYDLMEEYCGVEILFSRGDAIAVLIPRELLKISLGSWGNID